MEILILAAGNGSRMGDFTVDIPKTLIPINGIPIIDYILKNLLFLDVQRIIFVVGYQKDKLVSYISDNYLEEVQCDFVTNDIISRENGYSLSCAEDFVTQDNFLVIMADHIVDTEIYRQVWEKMDHGDIILATNTLSNLNDPEEATKVLLNGEQIIKIGKKLRRYSTYDIGVFGMSKSIFPILEILCQNQHVVRLSDLVRKCIRKKLKVLSCDVSGNFWMDIDNKEDIILFLQQMLKDESDTGNDEVF